MSTQLAVPQAQTSTSIQSNTSAHPGASRRQATPQDVELLTKDNVQARDLPSTSSTDGRQRRKRLHPRRYTGEATNSGISAATRRHQSNDCRASAIGIEQTGALSERYESNVSNSARMPLVEQPSRRDGEVTCLERDTACRRWSEAIAEEYTRAASRQLLQSGSEDADDVIANESVSGGYLPDEAWIKREADGQSERVWIKREVIDYPDRCVHQELQLNGQHPDVIFASQWMRNKNGKRSVYTSCERELSGTSCETLGDDIQTVGRCSSVGHTESRHLGLWFFGSYANMSGGMTESSLARRVDSGGYSVAGMANSCYSPHLRRQWEQTALQGSQLYVPSVTKGSQNVQVICGESSSGGVSLQPVMEGKCQDQQTGTWGVGMSVIVHPHESVHGTSHLCMSNSSGIHATATPVQFANQPTRIVSVATALGMAPQQSDDQTSHPVALPEHQGAVTTVIDTPSKTIEEDEKHARRLELKRQKYRMKTNDPVYMEHARAKKRERYHARRQNPEYVIREREKKRERYHRSRQNQQTVEKTREKKRELYHRARQDPNWVNKTRAKKKEIYYRARQNPNWVVKTREKKREVYRRARENPEWIKKTREKKRELYHRARQDPLYVQKQRERKRNKHETTIANLAAQTMIRSQYDDIQHSPAYIKGMNSQHSWRPQHNSMAVNALLSLQETVDRDMQHPSLTGEHVTNDSRADQFDPWCVVTAREKLRHSQLSRVSKLQADDHSSLVKTGEDGGTPLMTGCVKGGDEKIDCTNSSLKSKLDVSKTRARKKHDVYRVKKWAQLHKQKRLTGLLNATQLDSEDGRITSSGSHDINDLV